MLGINHNKTAAVFLNYSFKRGLYPAFVFIGIIIKVTDSPVQSGTAESTKIETDGEGGY